MIEELDLPDEMLEPVWRNLCAGLIVQAAMRIEDEYKLLPKDHSCRKRAFVERKVARKWLDGEEAIITFDEACRAVGLCPGAIKEKIVERAALRKRLPMTDPERPVRISRPHIH
jgi:hypothetical protein